MKYYDKAAILNVFNVLNHSGLPYLLLRNTNDELPFNLEYGKDIDILAQHSNSIKTNNLLIKNSFQRVKHPLRSDVRLYGVHQFNMYKSKYSVLLDINYEIVVRSLDKGQWIPLDQALQISAWENKKFVDIGGVNVPTLSDEDLWVCTLARCIFDKKLFSPWHQELLINMLPNINSELVKSKLNLIFFKFTDCLFEMVCRSQFDQIYDKYISFKSY